MKHCILKHADQPARIKPLSLLLTSAILLSLISSLRIFFDPNGYTRFVLGHMEIIVFAVTAICLYRGDYSKRRHYPFCLLYLLWILVTYLSRGDLNLSIDSNRVALVNQCALCCVALPYAHFTKDSDRRYLNHILMAIISVCAILIWLCLIGTITGRDITLMDGALKFGAQYTYTGRLKLRMLNLYYYHLGYLSVVCFFITLYLAVSRWAARFLPLLILMLCTFAAATLLTYSRTAVFALLGGLVIVFYIPLSRSCGNKKLRMAIFLLVTLAGIAATGAGMNLLYKAVHSIRDIWYGLSSLSSRTDIWSGSLRALIAHPFCMLFGFSLDTGMATVNEFIPLSDYIAHTHNGFLQAFVFLGLPGFLFVVAFFVYLIRCCLTLFSAVHKGDVPVSVMMLVPIPAVSIFINLFESVLLYGEPKLIILSFINALVSGYIIESSLLVRKPSAVPSTGSEDA